MLNGALTLEFATCSAAQIQIHFGLPEIDYGAFSAVRW